MEEILKSARFTWNIFLVYCFSIIVFTFSTSNESKYSMAAKELALFNSVKFTDFEAYVRTEINEKFWHPWYEYPSTKIDLLFNKEDIIHKEPYDTEWLLVTQTADNRERYFKEFETFFKRFNIKYERDKISPASLFPWSAKTFSLRNKLQEIINNEGDLLVFKPNVADFIQSMWHKRNNFILLHLFQATRRGGTVMAAMMPHLIKIVSCNSSVAVLPPFFRKFFSTFSSCHDIQFPDCASAGNKSTLPVASISIASARLVLFL